MKFILKTVFFLEEKLASNSTLKQQKKNDKEIKRR